MSRHRLIFCCLLGLGALLIFTQLSNRLLWDDEAETALLGRNTLKFGLPIAFDGETLISQRCGLDHGANYIWRMHSWLPMYTVAASFKLLGESTFSARFPFAVMGWLCIPSLFFLARAAFKRTGVALLAAGLLTVSVPFLLYSRQCRYYSIAILASIWILYFFLAAKEGKKFSILGLAASLTILFHSNFGLFFAALFGLAIGSWAFDTNKLQWQRYAYALSMVFVVNLPFIYYYDLFGRGEGDRMTFVLRNYISKLMGCMMKIDLFVLPILLIPILLGLIWKRRMVYEEKDDFRITLFLLIFMAINIAVIAFIPFLFFRYMVHLIPVSMLLLALLIEKIWRTNRITACICLVILVSSNLFHGRCSWCIPQAWITKPPDHFFKVGSPLANYWDEITHDFDGTTEAVAAFLQGRSKKTDRLLITHGDLPLRFYTNLKIEGGYSGVAPKKEPPEWIFIRHFFRMTLSSQAAKDDAERMKRYLDQIPWTHYRKIELNTIDSIFENIPEPEAHIYRTPTKGSRIILYEKIP